ncbi:MAG: hypothetical protein HS111_40855 [Kofleriaceae bacterium]|nr:hypothetical protein [Kofleriaceae bacterium]MCL4228824.1 hypothetical protein [Myxococcales bacterium]
MRNVLACPLATTLALALLVPAAARADQPAVDDAAAGDDAGEPADDTDEAAPAVERAPAPAIERDPSPDVVLGGRAEHMQTIGGSFDRRAYAHDWLVAPPGWNLGGEMRFVTAASSLTGERIAMTDMAILRLRSRWTATRRVELAGTIDLLAKQLDTSDEPIPQGGSLAAKVATGRTVALGASIAGGPTLGGGGYWGSAGTGAVHRSRIERFIAFQVGGGALATVVEQDRMPRRWQADAVLSSELVFHTPRGEWAMWGGVEMAFPVVHAEAIAPSSRLDLTVGTVFAAVRDWDLYAELTFRDRGTTMMPETVLPIVDGGFDQRQIVVGIARRFTPTRGTTRWALAQ